MLFTSEIFIFLFLPLVIIINLLLGERYRNIFLLAASLFFYAWGEPVFVLFMLASIAANHYFGISIEKGKNSRLIVGAAVFFNLALLMFFKYSNFVVDNFNNILVALELNKINFVYIELPIGISFFTFQAMSYVIDVYRKEASIQKNPLDTGLYISFFPQLIAGPIVRYHDIAKQIKHRVITSEKMAYGIKRFIIGFTKKMVIANNMGFVADKIFALETSNLSVGLSWVGIICYSLQIYFDFSGYSDMAIGLGRMFGFRFLENFNYPYISKSIKEFWRRWHISLSSWFRDYLYVTLGGNRGGKARTYRNLLIVFFLCGLWHGADWSFIVWGLFHGFFLVIERTKFGVLLENLWRPLRHMYTLLVVMVGWVFFRADNLNHAIEYLKNMFGMGLGQSDYYVSMFLTNELPVILAMGLIGMTPFIPKFIESLKDNSKAHFFFQFDAAVYLTFFLVSITYLVNSSYNPFIYFRF
jgi:alginate O-acetyltransferase complex protein AlgI